MKNESPIAPRNNDDVGKQKNRFAPFLVMISTALLLLGLVFYGGEYWGSHRARGDGPIGGVVIPIGDHCDSTNSDDCVISLGLDHGVCRNGIDEVYNRVHCAEPPMTPPH